MMLMREELGETGDERQTIRHTIDIARQTFKKKRGTRIHTSESFLFISYAT